MTVAEQARLFLAMGICGAALGATYDLMQMAEHMLGGGRIVQAALDLALALACAAAMIAAGLACGADPFRVYAFAGIAAGFTVYMMTLGTIVRLLCQMVYRFVKKS